MNILFVTIDGDPIYAGGTATIVQMMTGWLQRCGYYCAMGYIHEGTHPCSYFQDRIALTTDNENAIIQLNATHPFDILYITQCIGINWTFLRRCFPQAKFIAAYHNRPMLMHPPKEELLKYIKMSHSLPVKVKLYTYYAFYPLFKATVQGCERRSFKALVRHADKIQLLSEGFLPVFKGLIPQVRDTQIVCIGNPVVWSRKADAQTIDSKRKEVLVVCNANHQKRAHLMIEIWRRIEADFDLKDWYFTFVGDSFEVQRLKRKALDEYHLRRIRFEGRQKPEHYYERAAIFMMTSWFEGWPMVLMEAMPMGVVPIAYNSFESLPDIIVNKENGLIIPNNDMDAYVNGLKWLMIHAAERRQMAKNAIGIADRYSLDNIMRQYVQLFDSLVHES